MVPAKKGAVESAGMNKPLHKLESGAKPAWTLQFDEVSKLILKLELDSGVIGWGELYRAHNWVVVEEITAILLGMDLRDMSFKNYRFHFAGNTTDLNVPFGMPLPNLMVCAWSIYWADLFRRRSE